MPNTKKNIQLLRPKMAGMILHWSMTFLRGWSTKHFLAPRFLSETYHSSISHIDYPYLRQYLVGGLEHFSIFSHLLGMSSSQLTNNHNFSEGQGSTTNQRRSVMIMMIGDDNVDQSTTISYSGVLMGRRQSHLTAREREILNPKKIEVNSH